VYSLYSSHGLAIEFRCAPFNRSIIVYDTCYLSKTMHVLDLFTIQKEKITEYGRFKLTVYHDESITKILESTSCFHSHLIALHSCFIFGENERRSVIVAKYVLK